MTHRTITQELDCLYKFDSCNSASDLIREANRILHEVYLSQTSGADASQGVDTLQMSQGEQLRYLLSRLKQDGHPLFVPVLLAVFSLARKNEILGMQWGDIDLANKLITIRRTRSESAGVKFQVQRSKIRRVPISTQLDSELRLLMSNQSYHKADFLFPDIRKIEHVISDELGKVCKSIGLPRLMFHEMRRIGIRSLLNGGVPIHHVAVMTGCRIATIKRYLKP